MSTQRGWKTRGHQSHLWRPQRKQRRISFHVYTHKSSDLHSNPRPRCGTSLLGQEMLVLTLVNHLHRHISCNGHLNSPSQSPLFRQLEAGRGGERERERRNPRIKWSTTTPAKYVTLDHDLRLSSASFVANEVERRKKNVSRSYETGANKIQLTLDPLPHVALQICKQTHTHIYIFLTWRAEMWDPLCIRGNQKWVIRFSNLYPPPMLLYEYHAYYDSFCSSLEWGWSHSCPGLVASPTAVSNFWRSFLLKKHVCSLLK